MSACIITLSLDSDGLELEGMKYGELAEKRKKAKSKKKG